MTPLDITVGLLKKFEGCSLKAYQDIVGVWTIGYGETKGVKAGMVWTQAQADDTLRARAQEFMNGVYAACPRLKAATSNQIAACTSLAYNIGLTAFAGSSVCKAIARGDYATAADSILLWNKAGGKVVQGLVNRRTEERRVFMSPQT